MLLEICEYLNTMSLDVLFYDKINEPLCNSTGYFSVIENFNSCEQLWLCHSNSIYYYNKNGYMVKFSYQALLNSIIICKESKSNTYLAKCYINVRNINCKRRTCGNTCMIDGYSGNILVRYRLINDGKCVVNHWCEAEELFFKEEFYEPLELLSKECTDVAVLQKRMCSQKSMWIGNDLINQLYNILCNGTLLL